MNCITSAQSILHLMFQEGAGHVVRDASGHLAPAEIQYRFRNPRYISPREPSWRTCGIGGSALLFDGNSTFIEYPAEAAEIGGKAWTFSAWIAPRAFPCQDPEAEAGETVGISAVLGQIDPEGHRGFLVGYEAFGKLCFLIGDGERFFLLKGENGRLKCGVWNYLCAVMDGESGTMSLYLDGKPAGRQTIPCGTCIAPARGHALMIGRNEGGKRISAGMMDMFCGLMREAEIEARVLADTEILQRSETVRPEIPWEDIGPEDLLSEDPYKTQYHGGPRQHWMNEPHAPLYYRGLYHLFFQSNSIGTYWGNIAWGHLVSEDTVRWRQVRDAIVPSEHTPAPDGIWTGGAALDRNGVPVLFYTAADLTYPVHGLISNQNIGAALPADRTDPELKEWKQLDRLAVIQQPGMGRPGEFRDPHVWKEEDGWYMAVCGGSLRTGGGTVHVFRTSDLEVTDDGDLKMDWRYLGPAFEIENQPPVYGTSWELPVIMPLKNPSGSIRKHVLFLMPAPPDRADNKVYYYLGHFSSRTGRFMQDPSFGREPRLLDYGDNIFTGPSVFQDPVTGRICLFSIMQDKRSPAEESEAGWAHCTGLTRNLRLKEDGSDVCVLPDPRLYELMREQLISLENVFSEEANRALEGIREDLYCLRAVVEPQGVLELTLQADASGAGSVFRYDPDTEFLTGEPGYPGTFAGKGPGGRVPLKQNRLEMEIFVDRSLTEGFFQKEKSLSLRSYGPAEARNIFFSENGKTRIRTLQVCRMSSIGGDSRQGTGRICSEH